MGHFGFFELIKNYVETALLIDVKTKSQEASYTAQQNSRRLNQQKSVLFFCLIVKKRKITGAMGEKN